MKSNKPMGKDDSKDIDKPQPTLNKMVNSGFKKNPFQRRKEELELKKKKDNEDTAKVYKDFLASFQDSDDEELEPSNSNVKSLPKVNKFVTKTFVKGNSFVPKCALPLESDIIDSNLDGSSRIYRPKLPDSILIKSQVEDRPKFDNTGKKVRAMDEFLEELKIAQGAREYKPSEPTFNSSIQSEPSRPLPQRPSDPDITTLYIGNISPNLTEFILMKEFCKYGPIASVRIVWNHNLDDKTRPKSIAFVSYMSRQDSERAHDEMDGYELLGYKLKLGWGRAVVIPDIPCCDKDGQNMRTGLPFNAFTVSVHSKRFIKCLPAYKTDQNPPFQLQVQVTLPTDNKVLYLIHLMCQQVVQFGHEFESHIMSREVNNNDFKFLYDNESSEHVYYRWKLYSLLQGDSIMEWRQEPFKMFFDGPYFFPPQLKMESNRASSEDSFTGRGAEWQVDIEPHPQPVEPVVKDEFEPFRIQLDKLTYDRIQIGLAMVFAIEHVQTPDQITQPLLSALTRSELTPYQAIPYLYLISDILHNLQPTVPQAWKLRSAIEVILPTIFSHYHTLYKSILARLKAETYRKTVAHVLELWSKDRLFPDTFCKKWLNLLSYNNEETPSHLQPIELDDVIAEKVTDTFDPKVIGIKVKKDNKKRKLKIKKPKLKVEDSEDDDMFA